jgi:glycosyltransferase involved in cell wall biosynthesis
MPLSEVTILISTFLRPLYLAKALADAKRTLPECHILVVDDSHEYDDFPVARPRFADSYYLLPFDSGLSAKRNAGVRECETKYLLLSCDDFLHDEEARKGILKLLDVLDGDPEIAVAGGRVDNQPYEGFLEYQPGEYIRERRLENGHLKVAQVDITINYFLARVDLIRDTPWPEEMKIGGEHGAFFLDLKLKGRKVVWVSGVNIKTFQVHGGMDPRYRDLRRRSSIGHELMKQRYGIKEYIHFNGERD